MPMKQQGPASVGNFCLNFSKILVNGIITLMRTLGPLLILVFWSTNLLAFSNAHTQFNLLLGTDKPEDGETRGSAVSILKFGVTSSPQKLFRFGTGFAFLSGGGLQQGELSFGPFFYPFAKYDRSPVQPFLYGEGVLGVGSFDGSLRTDVGGGFGVGIDFRLARKWGMSLAIEEHLATEKAQRLFLGFYFLQD